MYSPETTALRRKVSAAVQVHESYTASLQEKEQKKCVDMIFSEPSHRTTSLSLENQDLLFQPCIPLPPEQQNRASTSLKGKKGDKIRAEAELFSSFRGNNRSK